VPTTTVFTPSVFPLGTQFPLEHRAELSVDYSSTHGKVRLLIPVTGRTVNAVSGKRCHKARVQGTQIGKI
jgi:hypothetical protein